MPIRVSSNGRYFVDEQGRPFFWLGDTQWELFRRFSLADARAVLEHRRRQGFTTVLAMVAGCCEQELPNLEGEPCFIDGDPAQPNEAYFRRADRVLEVAGELGLVLVLGIFHMRHRTAFTAAKVQGFAQYCAARWAKVPHLVWSAYPAAWPEYVPLVRALATGLRQGDDGAHLITLHPDPSPCSSSFVHAEEWLDFNCVQTWLHYHLAYSMTAADYARTPTKPVVLAEGGYEGPQCGAVHSPHLVRCQAWWAYLAGGHHCYGHAASYVAPETWPAWIDAPGALQMGACRRILESLPEWWQLVPDQSLLVDPPGRGLAFNAAARSPTGAWALAYLSAPTTATIRMDGITAGARCRLTWIDPATGARTGVGTYATEGTLTTTSPGGWEDTLVLFEPAT